MFHDSLHHNLTYLQRDADQASIDRWMHAFDAEDIAAALPEGYKTVLGDKGSVLSGGQRQLIGLVRTMLKQPDVLLLDEVTSSLDHASEAVVYDALDAHAKREGITRISVTHRLHGATRADRIIVLSAGELVEEGTHEQLLSNPAGVYSQLWYSQQKERSDRNATTDEQEDNEIANAYI